MSPPAATWGLWGCWLGASESCSLLDSRVDVLQHVLVKVFGPVNSLQIFLELLSTRTKVSESRNYQPSQALLEGSEKQRNAWLRAPGGGFPHLIRFSSSSRNTGIRTNTLM